LFLLTRRQLPVDFLLYLIELLLDVLADSRALRHVAFRLLETGRLQLLGHVHFLNFTRIFFHFFLGRLFLGFLNLPVIYLFLRF
jgi:hypothetical protein